MFFAKRLAFKFFANISSGAVKIIPDFIFASLVGLSNYGNLAYIRDSIGSLIKALDLNASEAFFHFSSKNKDDKSIFHFQIFWIAIITFFLFGFLILLSFKFVRISIFPDINFLLVLLGSFIAYLIYLYDYLQYYSESQETTVPVEKRRILVSSLFLFLSFIIYFLKKSSLELPYLFFIFYNLFLIIITILFFKKNKKISLLSAFKLPPLVIKNFFHKYYSYIHPLIISSILVPFGIFFDRWFLQFTNGSYEQGIFSLALRFSLVISIIISSFTTLIRQKLSNALSNSILDQRQYFLRSSIIIYTTSFASFFLFFGSDLLIDNFQNKYNLSEILVFKIMLLYPIHQSYGQICDAVMLSTEKTKLYRNIRIFMVMLGLVLTYYFVAPQNYVIPGLSLGAFGISLKIILGQFFDSNLRLYYVSKIFDLSFYKILLKQVQIIFTPLLIFYLSNKTISTFIFHDNVYLMFFTYTLISTIIFLLFNTAFPKYFFYEKNMIYNEIIRKIK